MLEHGNSIRDGRALFAVPPPCLDCGHFEPHNVYAPTDSGQRVVALLLRNRQLGTRRRYVSSLLCLAVEHVVIRPVQYKQTVLW